MSRKLNPNLKLLLDFAPLGVFFVAFKLSAAPGGLPNLVVPTLALMVATCISVGVIYAVERKLALAPLISGGLVMVMGGLGIALHNDQFIKMKPTLLNLIFSGILLTGVFGFKRGLLKYVLDVAFQLNDRGWLILSRRWGFFFLFLAALNECIWRNFPTEFWVNFKVFGMLTLTMAFALAQIRILDAYKE